MYVARHARVTSFASRLYTSYTRHALGTLNNHTGTYVCSFIGAIVVTNTVFVLTSTQGGVATPLHTFHSPSIGHSFR
jgi:hypothetical protein